MYFERLWRGIGKSLSIPMFLSHNRAGWMFLRRRVQHIDVALSLFEGRVAYLFSRMLMTVCGVSALLLYISRWYWQCYGEL